MRARLLSYVTPLALAGLALLVAGIYFFFFTRVESYGRVIGAVVFAAGLVALALKVALLNVLKRRMGIIWGVELILVGALWIYAVENGLP